MTEKVANNFSAQAVSPYVATLDEIQRLRFDFLLAYPQWIDKAHEHDPALNKYKENYDISFYMESHPEAFDIWLKKTAQEHNILQEFLDNPEKKEDIIALLKKHPEIVEIESYPGLTVMAAHEKAHELYKQAQLLDNPFDALSNFATARRLSEAAKSVGGGDIHPGGQLGKDVFMDHVTGVVVGETAIVGDGCFLLHGVTLGGARNQKKDDSVVGGMRRHPKLGNGVVVGSNANVYGGCDIGDNVFIKTGATIRDSDISRYAESAADKVSRTDIGTETRITNSTISEGAKIYANVNIFKSQIGEKATINANADITNCAIEKNATIGINAKLIDCVIGEGAIIGNGVSLEGVVVPPYATIYEIGQPKMVIYDTTHQGLVTARGTELSPTKHAGDDIEKAARASVFVTVEDLPKTILQPEDIALMREANEYIAKWKAMVEGQELTAASNGRTTVH